jgi:hypothetical protein
MFADKLCCFIGCIDIDASPGIGFFNLLTSLGNNLPESKGRLFSGSSSGGCCQRGYCQPKGYGYQHGRYITYFRYLKIWSNNIPQEHKDKGTQKETGYSSKHCKIAKHINPPVS